MNAPHRPAYRVTSDGKAIIADASQVSPADFCRTIFAEQNAKRERQDAIKARLKDANERGDTQAVADALLESVAEYLGMPLDELKRQQTETRRPA